MSLGGFAFLIFDTRKGCIKFLFLCQCQIVMIRDGLRQRRVILYFYFLIDFLEGGSGDLTELFLFDYYITHIIDTTK